jgi:hypothetical protein
VFWPGPEFEVDRPNLLLVGAWGLAGSLKFEEVLMRFLKDPWMDSLSGRFERPLQVGGQEG